MAFIAAAIIGGAGLVGTIGASFIQSNAAQQASQQQQQGLQQALRLQQQYFDASKINKSEFSTYSAYHVTEVLAKQLDKIKA